MRVVVVFCALIAGLFARPAVAADDGAAPAPPCTRAAQPASSVAAAIRIEVWRTADLLKTWSPPPCASWITPRFSKLVAVMGIVHAASMDELRGRFGAISHLRGLPYWSVSDHRLQPLIVKARAVQRPASAAARVDFTPVEITPGRALFFAEQDNRTTGETIYEMTPLAVDENHIAVEIENAGPVRLMMLTVFGAGDIRTTYFLDRIGDGIWRYYSLTGVRENMLTRGTKSEMSTVNRALAFYGFMADLPRDATLAAALPWAR